MKLLYQYYNNISFPTEYACNIYVLCKGEVAETFNKRLHATSIVSTRITVHDYTGPAQPVRLVRLWPDQYSEVTFKKIIFSLLRICHSSIDILGCCARESAIILSLCMRNIKNHVHRSPRVVVR